MLYLFFGFVWSLVQSMMFSMRFACYLDITVNIIVNNDHPLSDGKNAIRKDIDIFVWKFSQSKMYLFSLFVKL